MTTTDFEQLVNEGIEAIPKRFLDMLDNVAIVIEDFPTPEQSRKLHLKHKWALFGLYEGVPQTKRGNPYVLNMPDKITIFRQPIEQAAADPADIREMVKNTVWHEIAHHFGLDHDQIHKAEQKKSQKKLPN
jgi:predicted Zn-dependent protease with MMP-like domain